MIIDLKQVWRDKDALESIRAEIRSQKIQGWKAWEVMLPPDLLYPMIEEVSQGMFQQWSPVIDSVGVQVGNQGEIAIRFILPDLKTSPAKLQTMKYTPNRFGDTTPIEVTNGNKIRV